MSPILDATSLLPTGMVFDIVVDMMVDRFHEMWLFMFRMDSLLEILRPQESHVIGEIHKGDYCASSLRLLAL
jgi:hypothetical protein